jgi:hypothetical protein
MKQLIARWLSEAIAPLQDNVQQKLLELGARLIRKAALLVCLALAALAALIFLTLALFFWLYSLVGVIWAATTVGGLYLIFAGICALALRGTNATPKPASTASASAPRQNLLEDETPPSPETAAAEAAHQARQAEWAGIVDELAVPVASILHEAGLRREEAALLAGAQILKQLKPLPLVGLVIVLGFLFGRMFQKKGGRAWF